MSGFTGRDDEDLDLVAEGFLRVFATPVPPEVEREHLLKIMQTVSDPSRMTASEAPRPKRLRRTFRLMLASGVGVAMLSGLAFAGALPDAMQDALSDAAAKAGITLPASDEHRKDGDHRPAEQRSGKDGDHGKSVRDDVKKVLEDDSLEGKEKGDAVSDVASQNRQNDGHAGQGATQTATDIPPGQSKPKPNQSDKP